jgi:outer membrane protein TolC
MALLLLCGLCVLASCRAPLVRRADHAEVALRVMNEAVAERRARPPTTVTGKGGLTLEDCRSLALANNLELHIARVNELTKKAIAYSTRTKMAPQFLFSAELSERDNYQYSFSDVVGSEGGTPIPGVGGTGVTSYSTGRERSTWRYALETRWSPTDAALAYYLGNSHCNDALKAHYQKVRSAQKLLGVVESAFHRVLALQCAVPKAVQHAAARADIAAKTARLLEDRFTDVQRYHQAQKNANKARRLAARLQNELERRRNQLAAAIGLSPEYCVDGGFYVVGELPSLTAVSCVSELEMEAIRNRPEGFEAGLNHLNSVNDLKRTVVKYFPKVTGFWRYSRDKDRYLWNKDWKDVGLQVYFDLTDWTANNFENKAAAALSVKTHKEIAAIAVGVTAQVREAALKYFDAFDEVNSIEADLGASQKVMAEAKTRAAMDDLDKLAAREAEANVTQDEVERLKALGEAHAFFAELKAETGANYSEPLPDK